jgi:hypothetical protein
MDLIFGDPIRRGHMKKLIFLLLVVFCFAFTTSAYAGGYVTPNVDSGADTYTDTDDGELYFAWLEKDLSYCCVITPNSVGVIINEVSTTVADVKGGGNITAVDRQDTTPALSNEWSATSKGARLCLIPVTTGDHNFTITDMSVDNTSTTVRCNETTLFGGYNTNANPYNFLEISNITNKTINGKIYATNFDGTKVIDGAAFSVESENRIDINIHGAAGPNVYGLIKIVHDGPLGSLLANTSYYTGPVSALELKGTVPAYVRNTR